MKYSSNKTHKNKYTKTTNWSTSMRDAINFKCNLSNFWSIHCLLRRQRARREKWWCSILYIWIWSHCLNFDCFNFYCFDFHFFNFYCFDFHCFNFHYLDFSFKTILYIKVFILSFTLASIYYSTSLRFE